MRVFIKLSLTMLVCAILLQLLNGLTDLHAITRKTELSDQFRAQQEQIMRQWAATTDPREQALAKRELGDAYQHFISELSAIGQTPSTSQVTVCQFSAN